MNILAIGDVVGRSGRDVLLKHLSELKIKLSLDFIIVNGECSQGISFAIKNNNICIYGKK